MAVRPKRDTNVCEELVWSFLKIDFDQAMEKDISCRSVINDEASTLDARPRVPVHPVQRSSNFPCPDGPVRKVTDSAKLSAQLYRLFAVFRCYS